MPDAPDANKQTADETDDKGVPWSNRLKEMERKFQERQERMERELEQYKTAAQNGGNQTARNNTATEDVARQRLTEFVSNPDQWFERSLQEAQTRKEIGLIAPWLKSQADYRDEDKDRLIAIEREYGISHPSPMDRARAAYDILQKEKKLAKLTATTEDSQREGAVNANATEGPGKATPKHAPVTRNDLIRKLAKAESEGDLDMAVKLTGMLEDIR